MNFNVWDFVINHFNTRPFVTATVNQGKTHGQVVVVSHSPAIVQLTLNSVKLCLSLSEGAVFVLYGMRLTFKE